MATPTVRRLQLGNELRRLREATGTTPAQAAQVLGCNVTKISRIELGQSGLAIGDVKMLLESYGDDPEHVQWMMDLARNTRERGRWSGYRAAFPEWFRTYVDLEHDAEDIRLAEVELVPGLLQTEAYMRALYASAAQLSGVPDVEAAVRSRLERQEVLHRAESPTASFILSEGCVRRMIGGPAVMAEQVEHLVTMSSRRHVQLQIRPFDAESAPGAAYRFTMLRIPSPGNAPSLEFVYCEDFDDARYVDDKDSVRSYNALWSSMQAAALGPLETRSKLRELARQLTRGPGDDPR